MTKTLLLSPRKTSFAQNPHHLGVKNFITAEVHRDVKVNFVDAVGDGFAPAFEESELSSEESSVVTVVKKCELATIDECSIDAILQESVVAIGK